MRLILKILLACLLAVNAVTALAQPAGGGSHRREGGDRMSGEERQRLREELQRHHAQPRRRSDSGGDTGGAASGDRRAGRYAEWQRLSPEQREGIRREMRNANRKLDRRGQ